jgi:hypothetical protein
MSFDIGSVAAHLIAAGSPAVHASFQSRAADVYGYLTPYRSTANVSVTFTTLKQGLSATVYSDSSMSRATHSAHLNSIDLLAEGILLSSLISPSSQGSYGFRWSGFLKPQQVGSW